MADQPANDFAAAAMAKLMSSPGAAGLFEVIVSGAELVPLLPVPYAVGLGTARTPGGDDCVAMVISTPLALTKLWITPGDARRLGVELQRYGSAAATGLILPASS